ncbi:amino acid adenylation domain-containing protein [Nocardia brasiliensis]|uniref:amino acid adenylation domain-containing protein n=1 Tax=Nocardia brasiliensis TaxID=37326 RepID=UPI00366A7C44
MSERSQTGTVTIETVRGIVARQLHEDDAAAQLPAAYSDSADLIALGIDSLQLMHVASALRAHGVGVTFAELIETPTVAAWWQLVRESRTNGTPSTAPAVLDTEPFELAPMQQAYWIGSAGGSALGDVNAHYYAELDGHGVLADRLEQAMRLLVRRHPMLRAVFLDDGRQRVLPDSPWPGVIVHDLRELDCAAVDHELAVLRARLAGLRMDNARGEVFDVRLSLLPDSRTRLHLNIDMLIADATSFQVVLDELATLYRDPAASLPPVEYGFAQYLAELGDRRAAERSRAQAYWQQRIAQLPGPPRLPLAVDPERLSRGTAGRSHHWLNATEKDVLARRARAAGLTLPVVLATAFAEVIARWSEESRFLLNLPVFDREPVHPDIARVVGDFTNIVLLQVDCSVPRTFAEHAAGLQRQLHADLANTAYTGLDVVRDIMRERPGTVSIAPVVFTSAVGMGELYGENVRSCFGQPVWTSSQTPQVWLDQQVTEHDGGLLINWDVVEELFQPGVVDEMFAAYLRLLHWLGQQDVDWDRPVPELLPGAQAEVRARVNATEGPSPAWLLHEPFFERAAESPQRPALWFGESVTSYGELAHLARGIAGMLRAKGLAAGEPVIVNVARGPGQIAAVLGVLAAGGVYVPVGIDQPVARRERIRAGAQARWVLVDAAGPTWSAPVQALDIGDAASWPPIDELARTSQAASAYVIYTSGSTGEPKGVEVSHLAAANTVDDINSRYGIGADDRVLAVSALDFDLSVYDIFGTLSAGAALVLIAEQDRRDAAVLAELVRRHRVTVWNSVPALLDMLLVVGDRLPLGESLRLALVSGDWVGLDLPGRLAAQVPHCRFVALGGATEAAIWSNSFEVGTVAPEWKSIPYGFPLRNQKYRVVDERGRDRPDWVPGELWIGGTGVARGYRHAPDLTARSFVTHQGERWYRTGDIGHYLPDGTLVFLGRRDQQIKIRGHRIEIGEIEAALEADDQITRAVVSVVGSPRRRLVATVMSADPQLDPARVRSNLVDRLPSAMLPDRIVVVDRLPVSGNGKIDRAAIAAALARDEIELPPPVAAPATPTEQTICEIWARVLSSALPDRGISFFVAGGDSLTATRLVEALNRHFGAAMTLRKIYSANTVGEQAAIIDAELAGRTTAFEEGTV